MTRLGPNHIAIIVLLTGTVEAVRTTKTLIDGDDTNTATQRLAALDDSTIDDNGPQFGPLTSAVGVHWLHGHHLKFNIGAVTIRGRQYTDKHIKSLKDSECLYDCKVTGQSCSTLFSRLFKNATKKYVAGARDYGGLSNPMIYWDYKLCCHVSECAESSQTVNYEVLEPPVPIEQQTFRGSKMEHDIDPSDAQCLCCDSNIQCEQVEWAPEERCADKLGLTKADQLSEHCEAAFKVLKAPIKVKTELGQYFGGTASITQAVWWGHCKAICGQRGRSVSKTTMWGSETHTFSNM